MGFAAWAGQSHTLGDWASRKSYPLPLSVKAVQTPNSCWASTAPERKPKSHVLLHYHPLPSVCSVTVVQLSFSSAYPVVWCPFLNFTSCSAEAFHFFTVSLIHASMKIFKKHLFDGTNSNIFLFSPWGQSNTGAGCPGSLCSLHYWRFSKSNEIKPWATRSEHIAGSSSSRRVD